MCLKRGKKDKTTKRPEGYESTAESLESDGFIHCKLLPKEVEVTPKKAIFCCGVANKPTDCTITIANNSAKFATFKVLTSNNAIFHVDSVTGTVPAGEKKTLTVEYTNQQDLKTIQGMFYIRVFIALVETDALPEDLRAENPNVPTKHDGEAFIAAAFSTQGKFKIMPPPKEIDIRPDTVAFKCPPVGTATYSAFQIKNNSERRLAFKVIRSDRENFKVIGRAAVIAPGKKKIVMLKFKNEQEVTSDAHFLVFVALIDTDILPDEYTNRRRAPPTTYDGVKVLSMDISYDATGGAAAGEAGPTSQTGAPTGAGDTDFGTPAAAAAATPSPAAATPEAAPNQA